ncbi:MAG: hypothetical protein WBA41_11020 [Rivularia sp. (in: cyanobacteria)]
MFNQGKYIEKLIRQLHCRKLPDDVARKLFKLNEFAYNYLFDKLDDKTLTDYELHNIILVLKQMMYQDYVDQQLFVEKILSLTLDERISVRTNSCILATILFNQQKTALVKYSIERETLRTYLEKVLEMGLPKVHIDYLQLFIK